VSQGLAAEPRRPLVAIVGNPNAGKTTLFNALTGSHQKVGNYPGVTVEKVSGRLKLGDQIVDCTDLPGLYSLNPVSEDERVAVQVISGAAQSEPMPDLIVCVVDAGNLERNLFLFTQLADAGHPLLVALTMVDRIEKDGLKLNLSKLKTRLGVDVVPLVGHKERGLDDLRTAIQRNLESPKRPNVDFNASGLLPEIVAELQNRLSRAAVDMTEAEVRSTLLFSEGKSPAILEGYPDIARAFDDARRRVTEATEPKAQVANRYEWTAGVAKEALTQVSQRERAKSLTDRIDVIVTHRVFGLAIFIGLMYLVFQSIYSFAQPLMDLIQGAFDKLGSAIAPALASNEALQSFVVNGVIRGVGSMLVFLPQILILFFFVSFLEGSGYLARAAFLMDRLLGWCGLNGRAFIPLLSSYACAIPGIMSARVMPDPKARLATILVAPLMSCSARLPVYLLLIGAVIEPRYGPFWAGFALFAMHLLGLAVAVPVVWFINRKMLKGKRLPFLLELPPYQWPKWRDVWLAMYNRGKVFVKVAGTTIVVMSAIIWACSFFPRSPASEALYTAQIKAASPNLPDNEVHALLEERLLENSYLGRFGHFLEPAFRPAGFDWRITTSILCAFPARETVVPSLGIIFNLGADAEKDKGKLQGALLDAKWPDGRPLFDLWTSIGFMVFFALCCQCFSTLATIRRETNSIKWPIFAFTYMTVLAYIGAVLVYQFGKLFPV